MRYCWELDIYIDIKSGYIGDGDNKDFKAVGLVGNVIC